VIDLEYASDLPVNLIVEPGVDRPGAVLAECRFDDVEGEPVPGWLAVPSEPTETPAGVIHQHSTGGRGAFVAEAVAVAAAGGVALSIGTVMSLDPAADARRSILAIRRAADVLRHGGRVGGVLRSPREVAAKPPSCRNLA